MGIKSWMQKRKLKRQLSVIRKLEIDEVNSYMELMYNPRLVFSKPKYRRRNEIPEENELVRLYLQRVYNPSTESRQGKNHKIDEYLKGEI